MPIEKLQPNAINIHAVGVLDGIGDIQYLLNWFSIYHDNVDDTNDRVIFFMKNMQTGPIKLAFVLHDWKQMHPDSPIFEIIDVVKKPNGDPEIKIIDPSRCAIKAIKEKNKVRKILDKDFVNFPADGPVNVIGVSNGTYEFNGVISKCNIHELNGCTSYSGFSGSPDRLGLNRYDKNLGLLVDPQGIDGTKDFASVFANLSAASKKLIFDDANIDLADAKKYFTKPNVAVFGYLQPGASVHTLHSILTSPLIKNAIANKNKPLFFLTGNTKFSRLPKSIKKAVKNGEIRLVMPGFIPDALQFHTICEFFMNQNVNSLVMPSGDNTLSVCLLNNKLPFYAFKRGLPIPQLKSDVFFQLEQLVRWKSYKYMDISFPELPGYDDCRRTFYLLSETKDRIFHPSLKNISRSLSAGAKMAVDKMRQFSTKRTFLAAVGYKLVPQEKNIDDVAEFYKNSVHLNKTWIQAEREKLKYYEERGSYLTQDALDYFKDYIGPFLKDNCQFKADRVLQQITQLRPSESLKIN